MSSFRPTPLVDGLVFPEGPRWHVDRLWFSDVFGHKVMTVDLDGNTEVIVELEDERPSGIGFLPDGTPLVVLMNSRSLARIEDGRLVPYADLSALAPGFANDMVVGPDGTAWIGTGEIGAEAGAVIVVTPDREVRTALDDIPRPNGLVLTPDRSEIIFAATDAFQLIAGTVQPDGTLANQRVFADLNGLKADGICLDAEGAVWFGSIEDGFCRVREGGEITDTIMSGDRLSVAPMLGGPDRRHLFLAISATTRADIIGGRGHESKGFFEVVEVDVPGAGWP